jgi:protein tyrosine/serine phosphatase
MSNNFPISNYKLSLGTVYFSKAPCCVEDFKCIKPLNISCIFNLAKELNFLYDMEAIYANEVILGNIKDFSIPENMDLFIEQINKLANYLTNGENVYVHCMGGHGRTSMVIVCLLYIFTDLTKEQIFEKVKLEVKGPETDRQIEFVNLVLNKLT